MTAVMYGSSKGSLTCMKNNIMIGSLVTHWQHNNVNHIKQLQISQDAKVTHRNSIVLLFLVVNRQNVHHLPNIRAY